MVIKSVLKKILLSLFYNPVFTAALICAALFYSKAVPVQSRNEFSCLIPQQKIVLLSGKINSNPIKSSAKDQYSADFEVYEAVTGQDFVSRCSGNVRIDIPSKMIENLYPGKLYTLSKEKTPLLWEKGNNLIIEVENSTFIENCFTVKKAKALGFDKNFSGTILRYRGLSRLQFKRLMYGWGKAGGLVLALLSGSKEYTDQVVSDSFRKAGLSHILALSGMHLSLFGGLAFFAGNRLVKRNLADLLELGAIGFFVWFAGLSPSLFRAFLSSLIMFINSSLRMNRFKGLTVLSATFLIHLMIYPSHMETAAFMLSYGALAGIMSVGQLIKFLIGKRIFPKLSSSLSESAGAQIFTAPVTVSIFGALMPVGIIASVIVSPVVILFLYIGLAGTVLCLLMPFLSGLFNVIINCIYLIIKELVLFFSAFPSINFN